MLLKEMEKTRRLEDAEGLIEKIGIVGFLILYSGVLKITVLFNVSILICLGYVVLYTVIINVLYNIIINRDVETFKNLQNIIDDALYKTSLKNYMDTNISKFSLYDLTFLKDVFDSEQFICEFRNTLLDYVNENNEILKRNSEIEKRVAIEAAIFIGVLIDYLLLESDYEEDEELEDEVNIIIKMEILKTFFSEFKDVIYVDSNTLESILRSADKMEEKEERIEFLNKEFYNNFQSNMK